MEGNVTRCAAWPSLIGKNIPERFADRHDRLPAFTAYYHAITNMAISTSMPTDWYR
jgi:hypothetical protein